MQTRFYARFYAQFLFTYQYFLINTDLIINAVIEISKKVFLWLLIKVGKLNFSKTLKL